MFTGAILAKEGLEVTVLEKNAIIGGGLQSFTRFGQVFDTGMHIIGGMQKDGNVRRICEYLGIWDKVRVVDVDPANTDTIYFAEDGRSYDVAQGRHGFAASLARCFPEEKDNLTAYVDALYRIADEVDLFYLRPSSDFLRVHSSDFLMSADGLIAKYIGDEHLRSVLAYLNPLYGGRGDMTPAYVHALISVLYIDGPSRFEGGSVLFANTLGEFINTHGGRVLAGDPVVKVHSSDRQIGYVTTASGKTYTADWYISDIHPCTLFSLMDNPSDLPKSYRQRLNDIPNAYSAFTLNIKLKPGTFRYMNHTVYYMSRYDRMWKFGEGGEWPVGFLFITPPEPDQGEFSDKMIITAPMVWDEVRKWENTSVGHRGEEYERWKESCSELLLDRIEEIYPGFRNCVEQVNAASPLTIRDFYGVKEGSMCGYSKDYKDLIYSQVPVATKIGNLLLTGQNCNLHGFCGVALTAISTSEAILGRNSVLQKINVYEDIRPYLEYEIPAAMERMASHPALAKLSAYLFPEMDVESLRKELLCIDSCEEFQKGPMMAVVRRVMEKTSDGFSGSGIENIRKDTPYLFVSNHRDITLDAALLQYKLVCDGFDTMEVTFGANLMQGDFVIDAGKANRMFRVERPGTDMREFYKSSLHLSSYIRHTVTEKLQSVWIAQRNGRTKDGRDRTDQGITRMFALSGSGDRVEDIASLNIVPVAISYEWEPCDVLKALELYASRRGPYVKKDGEDLNSILTGLMSDKGRVYIEVCKPLSREELLPFENLPSNAFYRQVAALIDSRICKAYHLTHNNYIAHDLLHGNDEYSEHYSEAQKEEFCRRMARLDAYGDSCGLQELREIYLGIYANPVDSGKEFGK